MEKNHQWLTGSSKQARTYKRGGEEAGTTYIMNCHQRYRGPYTGTSDLLRQLVPAVMENWSALVMDYSVEIMTIAPELKSLFAQEKETLTSVAVPKERTRFYSRTRTERLANGLCDMLKELAKDEKLGCLQLRFEEAHQCDSLDAEFLSTLLRRSDPRLIQVIISSSTDIMHENLLAALQRYTLHEAVAGEEKPLDSKLQDEEELVHLAQRYVWSDCTSDNPLEKLAYEQQSEQSRKEWHDQRAEELTRRKEWSLHLGAIPYHRERGSSWDKAVEALADGLNYCLDIGFYEATIDFGKRGREWVTWSEHIEERWMFTTKMTTSYAALQMPEEAEKLYDEALAETDNYAIIMQASYALAMLYTRHYQERNHDLARKWMLQAIKYAKMIADPKDRSFQTVFNENGLALIELHQGNSEEALRLVTEGLERLDHELAPDEHLLHRSVLMANRAQILGYQKRYEEAIEMMSIVIERDPNYAEYYFERGNFYSHMQRFEEAVENYSTAIRLSPPFPEVYYNRAGVYVRMGEPEMAKADYDYLLDIQPNHPDALLNRATLLYERGQFEAARKDAKQGLQLEESHVQLLCTLGLIEMAQGLYSEALDALSNAIRIDTQMIEARTNRAVLYFDMGEYKEAVSDLTEALKIEQNGTILYNRAWVYQAEGKWQQAIEDYNAALAYPDADIQEISYHRGYCFLQLGHTDKGYKDWKWHLELGTSPYEEEIERAAPSLISLVKNRISEIII